MMSCYIFNCALSISDLGEVRSTHIDVSRRCCSNRSVLQQHAKARKHIVGSSVAQQHAFHQGVIVVHREPYIVTTLMMFWLCKSLSERRSDCIKVERFQEWEYRRRLIMSSMLSPTVPFVVFSRSQEHAGEGRTVSAFSKKIF